MGKKYLIFWNKKKYNFKILGTSSDWLKWFIRRPLIGRIFLVIQKGSKWPDPYFWVLIWLMDINFNALSKLFADFCNLSLPTLGVESLKPCCCYSMKSFVLKSPNHFIQHWQNISDYIIVFHLLTTKPLGRLLNMII